ncbi:MAG: bestrophin family ion channel [Mycobacterium sp.]
MIPPAVNTTEAGRLTCQNPRHESVGRPVMRNAGGPELLRTTAAVAWRLRYDLLAVLAVTAVMAVLVDVLPLQTAAPVVPLLGIVVSIFIGFRNSNAYARWWEARTLWGTVIGNGRAMSNALTAVVDPTPEALEVADRIRRRQARQAWQLAAELGGAPAPAAVAALTPEDPPDATSGDLLAGQGADIGAMTRAGMVDIQGRTVLVNLNTAQTNTSGGLERIRHQPIPRYYDLFIRGLAWFFAVMVCTRLDSGGHDSPAGIVVSILIMALFVVAERLGRLLEEPMSAGIFGLPMDRFCAELTANILGPAHRLAGGAQPEAKAR